MGETTQQTVEAYNALTTHENYGLNSVAIALSAAFRGQRTARFKENEKITAPTVYKVVDLFAIREVGNYIGGIAKQIVEQGDDFSAREDDRRGSFAMRAIKTFKEKTQASSIKADYDSIYQRVGNGLFLHTYHLSRNTVDGTQNRTEFNIPGGDIIEHPLVVKLLQDRHRRFQGIKKERIISHTAYLIYMRAAVDHYDIFRDKAPQHFGKGSFEPTDFESEESLEFHRRMLGYSVFPVIEKKLFRNPLNSGRADQ